MALHRSRSRQGGIKGYVEDLQSRGRCQLGLHAAGVTRLIVGCPLRHCQSQRFVCRPSHDVNAGQAPRLEGLHGVRQPRPPPWLSGTPFPVPVSLENEQPKVGSFLEWSASHAESFVFPTWQEFVAGSGNTCVPRPKMRQESELCYLERCLAVAQP